MSECLHTRFKCEQSQRGYRLELEMTVSMATSLTSCFVEDPNYEAKQILRIHKTLNRLSIRNSFETAIMSSTDGDNDDSEDHQQQQPQFKEHLNAAGEVIQIGDLQLLSTLGNGSYGTVRLARRIEVSNNTNNNTYATTTPGSRRRRKLRSSERTVARSHSAPSGGDMFEMLTAAAASDTPTQHNHHPAIDSIKSPIKVATETIQSLLHRSSSQLSSDTVSGNDEQGDNNDSANAWVAVKIFNKSVLKRKRTIERNRETRKVQVKTALDQVEREIALMKKLSHPNLVQFHEAIDSIETDMLYMVRSFCFDIP